MRLTCDRCSRPTVFMSELWIYSHSHIFATTHTTPTHSTPLHPLSPHPLKPSYAPHPSPLTHLHPTSHPSPSQGLTHPPPLVGTDCFQVAGVVLFNYAFSVTVPSWLNEKRSDVSVNKTIWGASAVCSVVFVTFGLFAATAFETPGGCGCGGDMVGVGGRCGGVVGVGVVDGDGVCVVREIGRAHV